MFTFVESKMSDESRGPVVDDWDDIPTGQRVLLRMLQSNNEAMTEANNRTIVAVEKLAKANSIVCCKCGGYTDPGNQPCTPCLTKAVENQP